MEQKTAALIERKEVKRQKQSVVTRFFGRMSLQRERLQTRLADHLSAEKVAAQRFETQGFVRPSIDLADQILDVSRTNVLTTGRYETPLVSNLGIEKKESSKTEQEALIGLHEFLKTAGQNPDVVGEENTAIAASMVDSLAFIGKEELDEASAGFAEYFKKQLDDDENLQIITYVGFQSGGVARDGKSRKSDGYILEKVVAHFSDDEIQRYGDRFTTDIQDASDAYRTKVVMLDDWAVSGTQLRQADSDLRYSLEKDRIDETEACLVVASEDRIKNGLTTYGDKPLKIKAYFKSKDPKVKSDMASALTVEGDSYPGYVTGAHSSSDFNFDRRIAHMVASATEAKEAGVEVPEVLLSMPGGTMIDRPYRLKPDADRYPNLDRFNKLHNKSHYDETGRYVHVYEKH